MCAPHLGLQLENEWKITKELEMHYTYNLWTKMSKKKKKDQGAKLNTVLQIFLLIGFTKGHI